MSTNITMHRDPPREMPGKDPLCPCVPGSSASWRAPSCDGQLAPGSPWPSNMLNTKTVLQLSKIMLSRCRLQYADMDMGERDVEMVDVHYLTML